MLGVTTSLVLLVEIWKPYFLFKVGFKENPMHYFARLAGRLALILVVAFLSTKICPLLPKCDVAGTSFSNWIIYAIETTAVVSAMLIAAFMAFSQGMRNFAKRMISLIPTR